MGVGGQLTDWPAELLAELIKRGYRVVTYDNRDAGLSTKFESSGLPDWPAIFAALGAGKSPQVSYSLEHEVRYPEVEQQQRPMDRIQAHRCSEHLDRQP